MKMIKLLSVPLLTITLMIGGCSPSDTSEQTATKPTTEPTVHAAIEPLNTEELITLLSEAEKLDNQFYAKRSYTEAEIFSFYDSHYTRNYIDRIVLGGGNWKNSGEVWELAYEGGELLEGTFFINDIDQDTMTINRTEDGKTVTLTNSVGDGLYAPHSEVITIVYTDSGWKMDDLKWMN